TAPVEAGVPPAPQIVDHAFAQLFGSKSSETVLPEQSNIASGNDADLPPLVEWSDEGTEGVSHTWAAALVMAQISHGMSYTGGKTVRQPGGERRSRSLRVP